MKQTIGRILMDARVSRCMTTAELACTAEVAESSVRAWEDDVKVPSIVNVQKMCKALHIKIQINEYGEVERVDET